MKIWIDCDGVMADFHVVYIEILNRLTGSGYKYEDFTDFDFAKIVGKENDDWVWRYIDATPGLVASFPDYAGALWGVSYLREHLQGVHSIGCLTSPHVGPHWMYERLKWLEKRAFNKRSVVQSSDKSHVQGTILVDDRAKNCLEWLKTNPKGLALLMNAPYNQGVSHDRMIRCDGWDDIIYKLFNKGGMAV